MKKNYFAAFCILCATIMHVAAAQQHDFQQDVGGLAVQRSLGQIQKILEQPNSPLKLWAIKEFFDFKMFSMYGCNSPHTEKLAISSLEGMLDTPGSMQSWAAEMALKYLVHNKGEGEVCYRKALDYLQHMFNADQSMQPWAVRSLRQITLKDKACPQEIKDLQQKVVLRLKEMFSQENLPLDTNNMELILDYFTAMR